MFDEFMAANRGLAEQRVEHVHAVERGAGGQRRDQPGEGCLQIGLADQCRGCHSGGNMPRPADKEQLASAAFKDIILPPRMRHRNMAVMLLCGP